MAPTGWFNKQQAAEYASVSVADIERWMKKGMPYSRPSHKCVRFHPKLIDKFLMGHIQSSATFEDVATELLSDLEEHGLWE